MAGGKQHRLARAIRPKFEALKECSDADLREQSLRLQFALDPSFRPKKIAAHAFPIVIEAIRRTTGKTAHDVQIYAAQQMLAGAVCEMKTGEGKTLTALLALYALSLKKEGVHLATSNDYLAARDAQFAADIFGRLGIQVGSVSGDSTPEERYIAYRKDITYGTAKEFGFDFLRDELAQRHGNERTVPTQDNILLDEADSLLIDEASTPLIIGLTDTVSENEQSELAVWANRFQSRFQETTHYEFENNRFAFLNSGAILLRSLPGNAHTHSVSLRVLAEYLENAIKANHRFQRDVHYRIADEKIAILDEFTGRIAEGRQWQRGLHQAVEAKENLEISPRTETAASVTMQTLINRYKFVTGMTGTAWASRREFKKVYHIPVTKIPTHRPVQRVQLPTKIFKTHREKLAYVVEQAAELSTAGRAILIGTRTLEQSEVLSQAFDKQGLAHNVLNASRIDREAVIVADAGQPGRITVATNMAGRGTDIPLHESVRTQGGLHVMLTELHESQRIDWQLIGRGARQGDPGFYQTILSLEDEILAKGLGDQASRQLIHQWSSSAGELPSRRLYHLFEKAQARIEAKQLKNRMILLDREKERQKRFAETGENYFLYPSR